MSQQQPQQQLMSQPYSLSEQILQYWFGGLDYDGMPVEDRSALWWAGGAEIDADISERFGAAVHNAMAGELDHWLDQPRSRLALIILLDQFTRNVFRGSAKAFAGDEKALDVCKQGLRRGHDVSLRPIERVFFYMPLEHAESVVEQDRSLRCQSSVVPLAPKAHRSLFESFVGYSRDHAKIIEQFGRYPHRNAVLGRPSTAAEKAYLDAGAERFGQ